MPFEQVFTTYILPVLTLGIGFLSGWHVKKATYKTTKKNVMVGVKGDGKFKQSVK